MYRERKKLLIIPKACQEFFVHMPCCHTLALGPEDTKIHTIGVGKIRQHHSQKRIVKYGQSSLIARNRNCLQRWISLYKSGKTSSIPQNEKLNNIDAIPSIYLKCNQ
jgi:hypothetical protein